MKKYVRASTNLKKGSYVVDRAGNLYDIGMHVPSTTYLGRGIIHLAPTDANFLYEQNLISEDDVMSILLFCYEEFLEDEMDIYDVQEILPLLAPTQFNSYAELKYALSVRKYFFDHSNNFRTLNELVDYRMQFPDFDALNAKWYPYLQDQFVKVSHFQNTVEFRISSNDGFDWNKIIIDKVILKYDQGKPYSTRYTIMRESAKGYQEYFYNATLDDILQRDKVVLSSTLLERKIFSNGAFYYPMKP